jgi:hypothetical protein
MAFLPESTSHAPTFGNAVLPKMGPMKILNLIHVMIAQAFYHWAMREIDPLHPDLPRILVRQKELDDKARRIFA